MRKLFFLALLFCFTLPNLAQDNSLTPYEIALQLIEEAEASGGFELGLYDLEITEVPPEIGRLHNLERLYIKNTSLVRLPPEIGNLTNLRNLYLSDNQLTSLPPEIGNLSKLEWLMVENNQLTSLPPEIGNLSNLVQLYLGGNQLTDLPAEIGNLKHLVWLYLSNNQLRNLPPEIGELSLYYLDLSNNQFQSLPVELSQIEGLRGETSGILLDGNPLISPPQEVIAQGTLAILDYLENEAWWHLQRLVVGGASSLGLVAAVVLGLRWRQRGRGKKKRL